MKASLVIFFVSMWLISFSQEEQMKALLVDNLNGYEAISDAETKTLNDGTLRISRNYVGGETSLELRVSLPAPINASEIKTQIGKLMTMFAEMAAEGRIAVENVETSAGFGVFTFYEGTGGAIVLVKDKYLIELQLNGVTGLDAPKKVFQKIDLTRLQ